MAEPEHPLDREIDALYGMLADILGSDKLVIKAGKMDAMRFMRSPLRGERVLALERIILENPTIESRKRRTLSPSSFPKSTYVGNK